VPTNKLTDSQCKKAAPKDAPYKLTDGEGMYLYVLTTGTKVWRLAYRKGGLQKTEVIGPYPLISLADAREQRDAFKRKLLAGEVPDRKEVPLPPKAVVTFKSSCETYWNGRKDITEKYRKNALRGLEMYLWPKLGNMDVGAITRAQLLTELNKMDAKGLHVYVRKVRIWSSAVFDWAVEQGHAEVSVAETINPKKAFGKAHVENFASLDLDDVPGLWDRLKVEQPIQSVLACKMLAYTWVRTKELRSMLWDQIGDDGVWRIPHNIMGKTKKEHLVPLSRQALALLSELSARRRPGCNYVFPAEHRDDRPMSDSTVLMLLYRLGYKGKMTGHGWRSAGSTWANERGYDDDAIERQLAHVAKDKVRAIYNRAKYLEARREILQAWADWLDDVDAGSAQGGNLPAHRALA
jgi:integrase